MLAVGFVFLLGAIIRLIDLTDPPLDFHGTRQLRNAIVARSIYYNNDPDIDAGQKAEAAAQRRSVGQYEPPLLETLVAYTYRLIGGEVPWVSRVYTTFFWLIGGLALFDLSRRMTSIDGAIVSAAYYLLLPFAAQASRSFQPDPGMVMWFVLAVYFLYRWMEKQEWKWAVLAGLCAGMAVLVKVVIGYMLGAGAIASVLAALGMRRAVRSPQVWVMALLMAAPSAVYYLISTPSGRITEYFNAWTISLVGLIASPAFYVRWLSFLHTLVSLSVLALALLGVILAPKGGRTLLAGLWVGYLIYGMTLPYQMYTHSYYHLQLVPLIGLSVAPVAQQLLARVAEQNRWWRAMFSVLALMAMLYPAWVSRSALFAEDFRAEPPHWQAIAARLPQDGEIIALTQDYGFRLMYYGGRDVALWPISGEQDLAELRGTAKSFEERFERETQGKSYFLVTALNQYDRQPDLKNRLENDYPLIAEDNGFLLFDMRTSLNPSP